MRQLITTPVQMGEIFRARRKARRVSQAALAARLGLSQGRLSSIEADPSSLSLDRLILLANVLGLEILIQDKTEVPVSKATW